MRKCTKYDQDFKLTSQSFIQKSALVNLIEREMNHIGITYTVEWKIIACEADEGVAG